MANKTIQINCEAALVLDVSKITPFQGKLKSLSKVRYEQLKGLILSEGYIGAIHVWANKGKHYCIDGHQRIYTLQKMRKEGYTVPELPVVKVLASSHKKAKKAVLAMISQHGEVDKQGLYEFMEDSGLEVSELENIVIPDLDMEDFLEEYYLDDEDDDGNENRDDVPASAKKRTKLGDVFELGEHRLVCGDCGDPKILKKLFGNEKADMVFTDPPYNVASETTCFDATSRTRKKSMGKLKDSEWDKNFDPSLVFDSIESVMSENVTLYWCMSHHLAPQVWEWCREWSKFHMYCVWSKSNPMPSLSKRRWTWSSELICYATRGKHVFNFPKEGHALSVWDIKKNQCNDLHPTQKPVDLVKHAIVHSSKKDQIVADFFGGSGTTIIACEETNRKCLMVEISPEFCDVIVQRWEEYTGEKARKLK